LRFSPKYICSFNIFIILMWAGSRAICIFWRHSSLFHQTIQEKLIDKSRNLHNCFTLGVTTMCVNI
jgi:hypothetical protein